MINRLFWVLLFLFTCGIANVLAEDKDKQESSLKREVFIFNPDAKGLTIGIHFDGENGYLYALVKNAGPKQITINTLRIDHWQFWTLELKVGNEWKTIPLSATIYKTLCGVATAKEFRKTLLPDEVVSGNNGILKGVFPLIENNFSLYEYHSLAFPDKRKTNRSSPSTGATVVFNLTEFTWPSEIDNDEILVRLRGNIFVANNNPDSSECRQQEVISPELQVNIAGLKELLKPSFSIRLAQNKDDRNMIDVYLRNLTASPVEFSGSSCHPWNPGAWFNIEVNGNLSEYIINVTTGANTAKEPYKPKEEKLFTQIDIRLLYFKSEFEGNPAFLRSAPKGKKATVVLSGQRVRASPSEPLEIRPLE